MKTPEERIQQLEKSLSRSSSALIINAICHGITIIFLFLTIRQYQNRIEILHEQLHNLVWVRRGEAKLTPPP